jgi:hypothetical protein
MQRIQREIFAKVHVSIATNREQQDWHKLELWLQLTCKCWQDGCSFTFFHVSSHCCKWSKSIPLCCKFVETVPVPFVFAHVSHVPSERFSCDGFLLNRLQASWMLHILDTCLPSYSPHRHPNPKHFSMMCTWTHMPSSSANANSSLQTNIEISNETKTSNPHNIKQKKKINRHWASLRKTSTQQKTVSWSPTIHLSQRAGGCGFNLAPLLNHDFSHQRTGHTQPIFLIHLSIGQAQIILQTLVRKISNFKHS